MEAPATPGPRSPVSVPVPAAVPRTTRSKEDQRDTELECAPYFADLSRLPPSQLAHLREAGLLAAVATDDGVGADEHGDGDGHLPPHEATWVCLVYPAHLRYVSQPLQPRQPALPWSLASLDASRAWILYWCLQARDLLLPLPQHWGDTAAATTTSQDLTEDIRERTVQTLAGMWSEEHLAVSRRVVEGDPLLASLVEPSGPDAVGAAATTTNDAHVAVRAGGFGGGPGQLPHAATTYATVLALCLLWTPSARALLRRVRAPLYAWAALALQQPDGGFRMHADGEVDVRATYCLLSVLRLLGALGPALHRDRAVEYAVACQTYEGGFAGEPGAEAHGGYTFCAAAALQLLGGLDRADTAGLAGWLARRQMAYEGGFQGRANKLVDGCYSFWVGAAAAIVGALPAAASGDPWLAAAEGGDGAATAPPRQVLFHTGMLERYILTCAQDTRGGLRDKPSKARDFYHTCYNLAGLSVAQHCSGDCEPAFGHPELSQVGQTHPVYNIRVERVQKVLQYFSASGDGEGDKPQETMETGT